MSDWRTSTFLLRKVGELKISDSSSDGSRDAFVSDEESSSDEELSSASAPSEASARKIVDAVERCTGDGDDADGFTCHEDSIEVIVDAWRGGGVRNASRDAM